MPSSGTIAVVRIHEITITRFRGIEQMQWRPRARINCLIGPSDVGKSSVLSAIELLLAPRPAALSEFDYFERDVGKGFLVEAVIGELPDTFTASMRVPLLHGWSDDGYAPMPEGNDASPVVVARFRGSADLEGQSLLLSPNGSEEHFPTAMRRLLYTTRLAGGERASAELRLGRGTLLQRHSEGLDLRAELIGALSGAWGQVTLPETGRSALESLRSAFGRAGLPSDLHFGVITPRGESLIGLVGLLNGSSERTAVPLANAGTGTRQLAMFELASTLASDALILLLDEPESGLEPYRQRRLVEQVRALAGQRGQVFVTTHSPAILGKLLEDEITRVESGGRCIPVNDTVRSLVRHDAEALLSRLPIIGEGPTEAGLLTAALTPRAIADCGSDLDTLGVRIVAGTGQPQVLRLSEALSNLEILHGLFVDAEHEHVGLRAGRAKDPHCVLGQWSGVRNIEEAVCSFLDFEMLEDVVRVAAEVAGRSLEPLLQGVGTCVGKPGKRSLRELRNEVDEKSVRDAVANFSGGFGVTHPTAPS